MTDIRPLFISGEYPPLRGGVSDYTAMLRSTLTEIGVESCVLSADGSEGPGVTTIGSWSWPVALHARDLVSQYQLNVVHIQYQAGAFDMHPAINLLPTTLTAWLRIPVVTTFHDLRVPYLFPKAGRLREAVMLRMARASSMPIVTNTGDQRILRRAEIEPTLIPLGPSLPEPSQRSRTFSEPTIGYFGFPSEEKGIQTLIQAIGRFPKPDRPNLVLVGGSRPDTGTHRYVEDADLETLINDAEVASERTGYLPPQEASNLLASTHLIALPFVNGASARSSALIAALRLGRPVITTMSNTQDDLDGLLKLPQLITVEPGDLEALYDGIRSALASKRDVSPLPEAYSWKSIANQHVSLYRSLLA